jgi:hypothetical protein
MSETRRTARALVAHRTERFESRHDRGESERRLARALERVRDAGDFGRTWLDEGGTTVLQADFPPSRPVLRTLQLLSVGMLGLVAACVWVLRQPGEGAERFLLPLFTALSILGLPFVTLGLGSARAAREARICKAIRVALQDEDPAFPPAKKWDDEE